MTEPYVFEIDDVLSEEFCKHIIQKYESDNRKFDGVIGSQKEVDKTKKTSIDFDISGCAMEDMELGDDEWKKIDDQIKENLTLGYQKYVDHIATQFKEQFEQSGFQVFRSQLHDTGYQMQRTDPGGFYIWHTDFNPNEKRILTFIFYLNDVHEEDGGATEFIGNVKVQPRRGKLLLFPATWTGVHRGSVLKRGVKYLITGWLHYR